MVAPPRLSFDIEWVRSGAEWYQAAGGRRPYTRSREGEDLGGTELDELDGVEILHPAANAFGGVEQHIGF